MKPVVVLGASLAGMSAVQSIRAGGFDGAVVVVDPSDSLPEDRPPLSKQVLSGEWDLTRATQPVARHMAEVDLDLDLRFGVAATALDSAARSVALSDGTTIEAAGIVVATGSAARRLPGVMPEGVHVLRTGADSVGLRDDLATHDGPLVVVGAGFIGAEVAATCREGGRGVTMIEAAEVPLQRVLPGTIGHFVAELHETHGVEVRCGVGIESLVAGDDGRVAAVAMADGTTVPASVVLMGIGAAPVTAWLEGSGLDVLGPAEGGGVRCDSTLVAAPGIVAAGDVAAWPNPHYDGELMRVEHWENAIDQGTHAGRRLLAELDGGERAPIDPFASVPWFWSDQYGTKIQMVGRPGPGDEVVVVEGEPTDDDKHRFLALFRRDDKCRAVLGVNRPRQVVQARMRLAESMDWDGVAGLFR